MKADLLQNNHFTYGATRGIPASGCNGRHRRHFKRKNDMKPMKTLPLLLLALAVGAQAQDDSDTGWHSSVGAKIGVAPRYLGSDKSGVMDKTGAKKRRSPYAVRLSGVESL